MFLFRLTTRTSAFGGRFSCGLCFGCRFCLLCCGFFCFSSFLRSRLLCRCIRLSCGCFLRCCLFCGRFLSRRFFLSCCFSLYLGCFGRSFLCSGCFLCCRCFGLCLSGCRSRFRGRCFLSRRSLLGRFGLYRLCRSCGSCFRLSSGGLGRSLFSCGSFSGRSSSLSRLRQRFWFLSQQRSFLLLLSFLLQL